MGAREGEETTFFSSAGCITNTPTTTAWTASDAPTAMTPLFTAPPTGA
jgi:hypothetical protein